MSDGIVYLGLLVVAGWLLFELTEHVLLPLYWAISGKAPRLHNGPGAMAGRQARVVSWKGSQGKVNLDGEIWLATSRDNLSEDESVVIIKAKGLTLKVSRASK